jgi:uncharacterized protein (DUF1501 family)
MTTRRDFLKQGALLSLAPLVPRFLLESTLTTRRGGDDTILVVLQLDGGNDGLNTVVPWRNEEYARLRPTLKIDPARGVKLGDDVVLHPSLRALARLHERGELAVVQSVGYPNPNRSHFESMRIWQTALLDAAPSESLGWLGLATDPLAKDSDARPRNLFVGPTQVPLALNGRRTVTVALRQLEDLRLAAPESLQSGARAGDDASNPGADLRAFVQRVATDSYRTAQQLTSAKTSGGVVDEPRSDLDGQLQTIALLIGSGVDARICYTVQSGYDTHASQPALHAPLLSDLAVAIDRFFATLERSGHAERVALLTFSEFGRRAAENAGHGTDHGAASVLFLVGPKVKGGLHGTAARLDELEDGDVRAAVDFRSIYATVLKDWLRLPANERSNGSETLPLFAT